MRSVLSVGVPAVVVLSVLSRGEPAAGRGATNKPFESANAIRYPGGKPPSAEEVELGKALFFDKRLSFNDTLACATCH